MEKWENPEIMSENQLPSKVFFPEESVSLNGKWRFFCQKASDPLPNGFQESSFPDKSWNRILVPGCAECTGFSEPWFFSETVPQPLSQRSKTAPAVDQNKNNTYLYRRSFRVPAEWIGHKIVIRFHHVRSTLRLWVNGEYIGMTKGCGLNAEFEITHAVVPDKNKICVQLWQYSDTSYLVPRNGWLMSGLMGDVEIYALPPHRILNMRVRASYIADDCTMADLAVRIYTENAEGYLARIAVMDGDKVSFYGEGGVENGKATAHISCRNLKLWSDEKPFLYKIAVILWDGKAICHTRQIRYGFRHVSIEGRRLKVNGLPVFLRGVNYQPFTPESGLSVNTDQIRQDLVELKKLHINAIRTAHGPVHESVYALCDELGFYIIDGFSVPATRADHCLWTDCRCQWADRMVRGHRSHCSVIIWSVTTQEERDAVLALDDSRPILCDTGIGYDHSDFCCVQFPTMDQLQGLDQNTDMTVRNKSVFKLLSGAKEIRLAGEEYSNLPLLVTDFCRFTGNGAPDLTPWMECIRNNSKWAGLFFHCVRDTYLSVKPDTQFFTGLLNGQGTPHHWAWGIADLFRPVRTSLIDEYTYEIHSDMVFTKLDDLDCRYELFRDGEIVESDLVRINHGEDGRCVVHVEPRDDMVRPGRYHLSVVFRTKQDAPGLPAGTQMGRDQWLISHIKHISEHFPGGNIRDDGSRIILRTEDCFYSISRSTGDLDQIRIGNWQLLTAPLTPVFDGGKTDGANGYTSRKLTDEWDRLAMKRQLPKPSIAEVDHMTHSVTIQQNIGSGLHRTYRLYNDGSLEIEMRLRTGKNPPRGLGLRCGLITELDHLTWFGRGPMDCYPDRKDAGYFALHTSAPKDQDIFPQSVEGGNKADVYSLLLSDGQGLTLQIKSDESIQTSVRSKEVKTPKQDTVDETVLDLIAYREGLGCSGFPGMEIPKLQPHTSYTCQITIKPWK